MHGWVATGQDDCRQSGRHTQGGGVIVLTSFLPLLSLLRAHHVGLAPPYKIPRGSGSARRSCLLPWNSQPDSGTLVHGPFSKEFEAGYVTFVHGPFVLFQHLSKSTLTQLRILAKWQWESAMQVLVWLNEPLHRRAAAVVQTRFRTLMPFRSNCVYCRKIAHIWLSRARALCIQAAL